MVDTYNAEQAQDALRPLRQFINTLSGVLNEQSWSQTDNGGINKPYQYQTIGSNGASVEGAPVRLSTGGDLVLSNGVLMLLVGAAAVFFLVK